MTALQGLHVACLSMGAMLIFIGITMLLTRRFLARMVMSQRDLALVVLGVADLVLVGWVVFR